MFNGSNFIKYHFGGGRFYMLPRSYKFSHGLCLNNFLQVFSIGNQRDQVTPFIYINPVDEVSNLVRGRKVLGDTKYLMGTVKQAAEVVRIWTEENWDVHRVNSLYTMVSGRFNFKINKRFDSLSWSSDFRYFYTSKGYIIGESNE